MSLLQANYHWGQALSYLKESRASIFRHLGIKKTQTHKKNNQYNRCRRRSRTSILGEDRPTATIGLKKKAKNYLSSNLQWSFRKRLFLRRTSLRHSGFKPHWQQSVERGRMIILDWKGRIIPILYKMPFFHKIFAILSDFYIFNTSYHELLNNWILLRLQQLYIDSEDKEY